MDWSDYFYIFSMVVLICFAYYMYIYNICRKKYLNLLNECNENCKNLESRIVTLHSIEKVHLETIDRLRKEINQANSDLVNIRNEYHNKEMECLDLQDQIELSTTEYLSKSELTDYFKTNYQVIDKLIEVGKRFGTVVSKGRGRHIKYGFKVSNKARDKSLKYALKK